ncbi:hypothetical protein B0T25DRAFT_220373 [Lasiosphaeria hispida]|uniref:Uncharacterized protein n=1 Tax=Lasiosphaeria hispida TaxID=260671 RepID=A0AAJ0MEQ1_9PEZI|nr:hypothetical protein B0T25DRAFT_220373 [Lasiosphaeria hispida]
MARHRQRKANWAEAARTLNALHEDKDEERPAKKSRTHSSGMWSTMVPAGPAAGPGPATMARRSEAQQEEDLRRPRVHRQVRQRVRREHVQHVQYQHIPGGFMGHGQGHGQDVHFQGGQVGQQGQVGHFQGHFQGGQVGHFQGHFQGGQVGQGQDFGFHGQGQDFGGQVGQVGHGQGQDFGGQVGHDFEFPQTPFGPGFAPGLAPGFPTGFSFAPPPPHPWDPEHPMASIFGPVGTDGVAQSMSQESVVLLLLYDR